MCGIAGIITFDARAPSLDSAFLKKAVKEMTLALTHRGPDSCGYFCSKDSSVHPSFHLGHTRLKVLDLSDKGHQPMQSMDGRFVIAHNGEIYNYVELREELRQLGYDFRTGTDTEIILHSYVQWGDECVRRFNGMWAFVVWDTLKRRLSLSRDRLGIKPLYYYQGRHCLVFASEIKALLASGLVDRFPDYQWIYRFLTKGAVDWDERTAFKSVSSLLPGHNMTVGQKGILRCYRYWTLNHNKKEESGEPTERFFSLLNDAVRLRLIRSDVPVGSCLSGGLDSSSIVALACRNKSSSIKTFSAEYPDPDCSEGHFVDLMAKRFPLATHSLSPSPNLFWETLESMAWYQDEPFAAYGAYSQWFVFSEMAKEVTVALDGQGGDELLGGYFYYFESYLNDLFNQALAARSHSAMERFWAVLHDAEELTGIDLYARLKRRFYPSRNGAGVLLAGFQESHGKPTSSEWEFPDHFSEDLNNTLYWTLTRTSLPALLHYEDRMSMAFSVEARLPFLDHRVVEYCFSLPASWKIHHTTTKRLLREAMKDLLPVELIRRRDKKGYATPMARWFRNELRQGVADLLTSRRLKSREILDPEKLMHKFHEHLIGEKDHTWEIWRWISLEIWFRTFIDRQ